MKIYCVHPINGLSYDEVIGYYDKTIKFLASLGYEVFNPMLAKEALRNEKKFAAEGYGNPTSTNHAIFHRDKWMCLNVDIIYANFIGAKERSIGSMMELAWASDHNKQIVVIMEKQNPHRHAFVLEAATIIFETEKEADEYFTDMSCMNKKI